MNKFIGIGRLTKEIEIKATSSGKSYVQNTIAIKKDFKNAEGNYDSEFINIVLWNKTAEFLANYGSKGCLVGIEGRLTNRSYDKEDGTKGYITEVVCDKLELLSKKENNEPNEEENNTNEEETNYDDLDDGTVRLSDEDLPF